MFISMSITSTNIDGRVSKSLAFFRVWLVRPDIINGPTGRGLASPLISIPFMEPS